VKVRRGRRPATDDLRRAGVQARLFHIILALLKEYEESRQKGHHDTQRAAHDNPEKVFETMIAWGRYAGLMDTTPAPGWWSCPRKMSPRGPQA
jgi:NitT/TauT family transport system ATP-binding protein